ncbi:MAG: SRPBCC domain-containing protein [Burkholderiaceae bacterium]|nr:SRPBCC domain-containing protein [Burkholderiaceae bacterium]MDH3460536.1 SRPBCC domain-containing protein [Burkholderiaceae bacterium]
MPETIHQEVTTSATPERILKVLTDSDEFSAATGGAPAVIDAVEGGAFSCFGGMISGRNIEIVAGQRLVQAWRVKTWPPGIFSIVRFELKPQGADTLIVFDHLAFPATEGDHLASGWHANYWEPITKFLARRS